MHGDQWEDKTQDQQIKWVSAGTNKTDGRQYHDIGYESPSTEIMKSSQKFRSGEIKSRSGHISCRLEKLGINKSDAKNAT